MSERECGPCSVCCTLAPVPELDKPANTVCRHCILGRGCQIYERRPQICRTYECGWLANDWIPRDLRPDRSGFIIANQVDRGRIMIFALDPSKMREQPRRRTNMLAFVQVANRAGISVLTFEGEVIDVYPSPGRDADEVHRIAWTERKADVAGYEALHGECTCQVADREAAGPCPQHAFPPNRSVKSKVEHHGDNARNGHGARGRQADRGVA